MLENLSHEKKLGNCKVRSLMETLDKKDAELLLTYIADVENWSSYSLSSALSKRGVSLDDKVITKHRDKLCTCAEYYARENMQ